MRTVGGCCRLCLYNARQLEVGRKCSFVRLWFLRGGPSVPTGTPFPIAKGPSDFNEDDKNPFWGGYGFGSYHASVCNFLVGDGSVQSLSVTTPPFPILVSLAMVNDGESHAIP